MTTMFTYIIVGYGDEEGYRRTDSAVRDDAHAHDDRLRAAGARMGVAGTPVQVRNHGGAGAQTTEGPFMRSSLPAAGFTLIEAASLDEAIAMASWTPCAVAYGVVEIWPLGGTSETEDGPSPDLL